MFFLGQLVEGIIHPFFGSAQAKNDNKALVYILINDMVDFGLTPLTINSDAEKINYGRRVGGE